MSVAFASVRPIRLLEIVTSAKACDCNGLYLECVYHMEEDELFIEAVRGFQCLWKVRSKGYKDLRAKENAWKAISEEVSCLSNPH